MDTRKANRKNSIDENERLPLIDKITMGPIK